ncbi:hypothetical protein EYF80_044871 [Liparis tanakae]|uniref:Uncharacterized protein n=1 Tax=Liparis tanakae TaxID=230148 RepID=A0A4Z2FUQ3_9TELE|nr:hypothetical protein EYF80_044871 [Liparis tanakae]
MPRVKTRMQLVFIRPQTEAPEAARSRRGFSFTRNRPRCYTGGSAAPPGECPFSGAPGASASSASRKLTPC